jgi:hypothetical protein
MIKIDASNVIPKRFGTYLLGIIPGFLFEIAIAFGDPALGLQLINRVRQIYPFHGYALLTVFVVSCLFVGQTFYFLSWFLDWMVDLSYRSLRYFVFFFTLGSDWLYKAVGRWQGMPPKPSARHLWRPIIWARRKKVPFEIRPVLICQRVAALQLLRRKYGVLPRKGPSSSVDEEWQAWLAVLGKPLPGLHESFLFMRVSLACGLAGLTTLYLCAELRNRYFVTMCSTLLLAGVIQTISFALRRNEPIRRSLTTLASIMQELAELSPAAVEKDANSGPSLTLQGNDNGANSD